MAQNTEELNENTEELTSYTSETPDAAESAVKERPALTVAGSAVGRRKEAIARVRVVPGTGKWIVNGRELADYFPNKLHQQEVNEPFKLLDLDGAYDVIARIHGGGASGHHPWSQFSGAGYGPGHQLPPVAAVRMASSGMTRGAGTR